MTEKDTEKTIKFINIIESILWIITLAVTTIVIIILTVKQPKKQASAQEVKYYIETGIYEFNNRLEFNEQLAGTEYHGIKTRLTEENSKYTMILTPNFRQETAEPNIQFSNIFEFWVEASQKYIDVHFDTAGDGQIGEAASPQQIYTNSNGWYYTIIGEAPNYTETIVPINHYTLTILEKIEIDEYMYWFIQHNTTKIAGGTTSNENYQTGYETGYQQGVQDTVNNNGGGFDSYEEGYNAGQTQGYNKGYQQAMKDIDVNNPYTFNNLIGAVMRAPSEFFKSFWGTEILGFNLSGLISVMFTMALVFAVFGVVKRFI